MEFRLLGPLDARDGSGLPLKLGGGKQRALLAVLLLNLNRTVPVERLVDELWGEDVPETAAKAVQIYVSQLRKVLPREVLQTRAPGYAIELPEEQVDLYCFERMLADGREALAADDGARASDLLREALALWRGPALAEFAEPFAEVEGRRLEERRLAALEERIEADLVLGRHADLTGELEALVGRNPLRERLRGQQMLALYRCGRQADALAAYHDLRNTLDEELGIEPSQSLRDLERRILQQDAELIEQARAVASVTLHLKGIEEPRRLDAALESASESGSAGDLEFGPARRPRPGTPSPSVFVGRLAELERLEDALARAKNRERQIVCVTGEAGLGKTTLVQAFLAVAADDRSVRVAHGRCIEHHGASEAYLPVLEALGRLCGEPEGDRLARLLAARAPTWLVQLPGLVSSAELTRIHQQVVGATRERMLREMVDLLDELAADRTLVLVLEDMHWSDYSTLDLLTALAQRVDAARLLVLGTYRPGDALTAGHPLHQAVQELRLRGRAREIALEPFAEQAVGEYLRSRFPTGGLPDGLAARLQSMSGGNPLFVETLVDSWVSGGRVVEENGTWRAEGELGDLAEGTPDSLRLLIEQQLERLDGDDQAVLEVASVAGSEFAAAAVAAALESSEEDIEDRLTRLARRGQFVVSAGPAEWPDGTVSEAFRFAHDLYPDVLYARIPVGRRARLHHRIGARLEDGYPDDRAPVATELAGHFVNARDTGRAMAYLELAAMQALGRNAPRDALPNLQAALEEASRLVDEGERARSELRIQMQRGPAIIAVEGWVSAAAEAAYVRSRVLAEALGDTDALIAILYRLATMYEVRGEYTVSEALIEECLALEPSESSLLVDSLAACSLFHQGKHERTLDHAERGVTLMDASGFEPINAEYGEDPAVSCHGWSALALWFLGFPDRARERAHEAIRLSDDPRLAYGRSAARLHAATVHQLRREPELVSDLARQAFVLSESQGYLYRTATGRVLHGWAGVYQGKMEGLVELRAGIELARTVGARMDDGYFLALLAEALELAGEHEKGLDVIDEALAAISEERPFFFEPELLRLRASLLVARGSRRLDEARANLIRAIEVAEAQNSPSLALRAAVSLMRLGNDASSSNSRGRVARIYARFDEGFDTHDLREAATLLERTGSTGTIRSA
jgi:DNA-binding SARP family transcriptional activator/type II secretory pathway predicted ATPase ExeA/tetratricopeptide (TPR) repeat protein